MAQDAAQALVGKFVDSDSLQAVPENGGCTVRFSIEACPDQLLTDGGVLERKHPKVKEIRKLEADALAILKSQEPFTEDEPQPPAKDAPPAAQRSYQEAHAEWDARRVAHEADLRERSILLRDHHESKDLFVVAPAGRPIFSDREYIEIITPGDKDNIPHRPVRQSDVEAYRDQYERWKRGAEQSVSGTPLAQMPGMTKSQAAELGYFNIRSVEALASVSDGNLAKIGPITALRQKARDWLAAARGMAPVNEARAEASRLREEMKDMRRQMAELLEAQQGGKAKQARQ